MKPKGKITAKAKKDNNDIIIETEEARLAFDSFTMHAALGIYTMNPHSPQKEEIEDKL